MLCCMHPQARGGACSCEGRCTWSWRVCIRVGCYLQGCRVCVPTCKACPVLWYRATRCPRNGVKPLLVWRMRHDRVRGHVCTLLCIGMLDRMSRGACSCVLCCMHPRARGGAYSCEGRCTWSWCVCIRVGCYLQGCIVCVPTCKACPVLWYCATRWHSRVSKGYVCT